MSKWYPLGNGNSANFELMLVRDTHIEDAPTYKIRRDAWEGYKDMSAHA